MRFQFNLQTQTLKIVKRSLSTFDKVGKEDYFLVIPEEWKFPYFSSVGFILDPEQAEHRIIFSVAKEKVQVLYKFPHDGSVICYKRIISRPASGIVEVEFSE
jgi:hypothetical protein